MNMYGDIRTCIKCKNKANVVEKGKDYCASCWFKYFLVKLLNNMKKELMNQNKQERIKSEKFI